MWKKNIIYKGKIKVTTGLHIGSGKESLKIGGTDNPVVTTYITYNDEKNNKIIEIPYIPGSSIKGKMRSLLSMIQKEDSQWQDLVNTVFGMGLEKNKDSNNTKKEYDWQTRIIIRDAFPTKEWIKNIAKFEFYNGGVEVKGENTINKMNGSAQPRFIERVIPNMEFDVEILVSIFDNDNEQQIENLIKTGIELIEDSYLGGNGSRGYGKVKFDLSNPEYRDIEYYRKFK